ncbi:hypothetical protein PMI07_002623 [Rhizobium sp. CF080]|uniref:hypothetical protein n=1 Tax=Rhizobium sp. (strain CF080) TaxID=1144310 RepID=UPI00027167B5|nr:hypothetical protein [Rhizobium sp. CF080]EUB94845.1 hypothetical protein PMI07_002623 [Rhizobium sp. CF080]
MQPANSNRPFEGSALANVLQELAEINVRAMSLKYDLEPLSEEDISMGAEPLGAEQIAEELDHIATIVTRIVLEHLKAEPGEWYEANDKIE